MEFQSQASSWTIQALDEDIFGVGFSRMMIRWKGSYPRQSYRRIPKLAAQGVPGSGLRMPPGWNVCLPALVLFLIMTLNAGWSYW